MTSACCCLCLSECVVRHTKLTREREMMKLAQSQLQLVSKSQRRRAAIIIACLAPAVFFLPRKVKLRLRRPFFSLSSSSRRTKEEDCSLLFRQKKSQSKEKRFKKKKEKEEVGAVFFSTSRISSPGRMMTSVIQNI